MLMVEAVGIGGRGRVQGLGGGGKSKSETGVHFFHLPMDLAVNLPHRIATFGGVLLLTASHMISQLVKCKGSPPHLLMRLHGPKIRSLLLVWQPLVP